MLITDGILGNLRGNRARPWVPFFVPLFFRVVCGDRPPCSAVTGILVLEVKARSS